jgi:hypothetical protein
MLTSPLPLEGFGTSGVENSRSIFSRKQGPEL